MTRNSSKSNLLAQIFAAEENLLHPTASGFRNGHEPVHSSASGTCMNTPAEENHYYCHNCQQGDGTVEAVMSLKGISREKAEAYLRAFFG